MTEAILIPARASETRLVGGVCLAHLISHYYMLLLAPLFLFIKADYGVSYTELSLALIVFNVVSALADSFWLFIAMYAVMGLANTVYHPADYTLLSERVAPRRLTQVFSFHTCAGMIGSAVAPVSLLFMQDMVGWRGAFLCAAAFGVIAALILALQAEMPARRVAHAAPPR